MQVLYLKLPYTFVRLRLLCPYKEREKLDVVIKALEGWALDSG
jgi:hypothetical protein